MKRFSLKKFIQDESGAILIMFALMINVLVLAVALPMDLGRGYMASSAMQGAADAAAVASAIKDGDAASAEAYFKANLPNGTLGITYNYATDVTHTVDPTEGVRVSTNGFDIPAFFSGSVNLSSSVNVGGSVLVGLPAGTFEPADYFFIIDSSGSMGGSSGSGTSKAQAVGIAINNFLDLVFANQGTGPNGVSHYRVSLTNYRSSYGSSYALNDDKPTIISQLNPMLSPGGATMGGAGWRLAKDQLIDEWVANGNSDRRRIFIFMTDGMLNQGSTYMNPIPPLYDGGSHGSGPHGMAAMECYAVKNLDILDSNGNHFEHQMYGGGTQDVTETQDVSVWTVRFGSGANSGPNRALMDYCASDLSQSVYAATGNDLDQIFSQIGRATARVRKKE